LLEEDSLEKLLSKLILSDYSSVSLLS